MRLGVVGEQERLASAPDSVLVSEPTVGATARTKGGLYLVAAASEGGPRMREATALVAETVQRQYYYDESAGIAVCLKKAIRAADQRLRHQRERLGVPLRSIGVAAAVVRGHELYVTTVGEGAAFLLRQARLLTLPDEGREMALPYGGDALPDVWWGELSVGDTLVLTSRSTVETIGSDELKSAIVTLHPQSAAEHLHHLYVAAGGETSDALLVIEATEVSATTAGHALVPVKPAEPLAGVPDRSPIPLAEPLSGGVEALSTAGRQARQRAGGAIARFFGAIQERLPRRGAGIRRVTALADRRESERRLAVAAIALLGVVVVLAVGAWWIGGQGPGPGEQIHQVTEGEKALAEVKQRVDQVFGGGADLVESDPNRARRLLREAYEWLTKAATAGVSEGKLVLLRQQIVAGLDRLYEVRHTGATTVFRFDTVVETPDLGDVVRGPLGEQAAYVIERSTKAVYRVDLPTREAVAIVAAGTKVGDRTVDEPWMLATGGPDLLVLDRAGVLWRWRPADTKGEGTLSAVLVGGDISWGDDIGDVGTYLRNAEQGLYNLYIVDPSSRQILRYTPALDGSGFQAGPSDYLAAPRDLDGVRQILIDGDIYLLEGDGLARYEGGQKTDFGLSMPEDTDLRPEIDLRLFDAVGERRQGSLFVWDTGNDRIIRFARATGDYVEQFTLQGPAQSFTDVRGLFAVPRADAAPLLYWIDRDSLLVSVLEDAGTTASPSPGLSPGGSPSGSPSGSPGAASPTPSGDASPAP